MIERKYNGGICMCWGYKIKLIDYVLLKKITVRWYDRYLLTKKKEERKYRDNSFKNMKK